jgi:hypothetical protein
MTARGILTRLNWLLPALVLVLSLVAGVINPQRSLAVSSWDAEYWNLSPNVTSPRWPIGAANLSRTESGTENGFNIIWGTYAPDVSINADGYVVRWTANQTFSAGYHHFTVSVDGGFRVLIDGEKIYDGWTDRYGDYESTRYITAGTHEVVVEYFDYSGAASITFDHEQVLFTEYDDAIDIYDCEDLQAMNEDLTANYRLANNIDCSTTSSWDGGAGFMPVGDSTVAAFDGTLDGNNKLISNLYINRPGHGNPVGLFGKLGGVSQVKDLYIANADIVGGTQVGVLAGLLTGTAYNVRTSGTITAGGSRVGGLVGEHSVDIGEGSSILNCISSVDVDGTAQVGGLVGYNSNKSISWSSATGNVSGTSSVGGLVGYALDTTIEYSRATGDVSNLDGEASMGGLVGYIDRGLISNSYASGDVFVEDPLDGSNNVGGLVGSSVDTSLKNVAFEGDNVSGGNINQGGLIGLFQSSAYYWEDIALENASSRAEVSTSVSGSSVIGGLIGGLDSARIDMAYSVGNVTVSALDTTDGAVGGLVGSIGVNGDAKIDRTYSEGNVTILSGIDDGGIGGLVGSVIQNDNAVLIKRSFATGNVLNNATNSTQSGGLIGGVFESGVDSGSLNLVDTYSMGSITGAGALGGLIGRVAETESVNVALNYSFSIGEITPADEDTDYEGAVGINNVAVGYIGANSVFWDSETTGVSFDGNIDIARPRTTEQMKNIRTYTDSTFNTYLDTDEGVFDFSGTQYDDENEEDLWDINGYTNSGYPFFNLNWDFDFSLFYNTDNDSQLGEYEYDSPNSGDANDDDLFDDAQSNVTSFDNSVSGSTTVLEVSSQCVILSVDASAESTLSSQDSGHSYPVGLVNFMAECDTPGSTVTVSQYFYDLPSTNLIARKFSEASSSYNTISGAVITEQVIGGRTVTKVTYQVTDGGSLDEDGVANGVIVDPSGPTEQNTVGAPNTGLKKIL